MNKIIVILLLISTDCSGIRFNKAYTHRYKGGHYQSLTLINDSTLRFVSSVSMLSTDITGNYTRQDNDLLFIPAYNDTTQTFDSLPFPTRKIFVKNRNTLLIGGIKFKKQ